MTAPARGADSASLTMLGIGAFLSVGSMRACDPLLPAFATVFSVSTGVAAHAVSSFSIAYGFMQFVYGYLGDRHGKYRVIAFAATACTAGNLAAALSGNFDLVIAARILSGATAAGIIPLALAWVGDAVPYENRQPVLAKIATATILGGSCGQWVSGLVADTLGWRWVFVLLSLAFLTLGTRLLSKVRANPEPHVAAPGSYGARLLTVLRLPWARWILLVTLMEGAFAFSAVAFLPAHLHDTFGISIKGAAAIVAMFGIGGLLYSTQASRVVPRLGEPRMAAVAGTCLLGAFVTVALATDWRWSVPACLLGGFGFNMLHNTLQTHATQMAPAMRGTAMALFGACLFIGQSLGVWAASLGVDRFGYRPIFAISATVMALLATTFVVSLVRRRTVAVVA